jgi:hypothetical protein
VEAPFQLVTPPSERKFGFSFAIVFAALAARAWWTGRPAASGVLFALSVSLLIITASAPRLLRAPNRIWFRIGLFLSRFMSPIVIGAMFILVVTPLGLLMRAFGRDPLRLRFHESSYWVPREPPGPAPESFTHQF